MKISILSMQHVYNFGSVLQAYSLKKILEELSGEKVCFLPIQSIESEQKNALLGINHSAEKDAVGIKKYDKYIVYRMLNKCAVKKQNRYFKKFQREVLDIKESVEVTDLCVIGSDEVFNCRNKSNWGFSTQLFGNVQNANYVITYAASCGFTKVDMLNDYMKAGIRKSFENISGFSVRDKNTYDFVRELSGRDAEIHFDPVLVGNFESEIEEASKHLKVNEDNLCIVYSYHNRIHDNESIHFIKQFAKKKKLKLVTVGAPQKWIPCMLPLDPFEMLALFKKAKFVITDTFHGTIFASKYNGNFAVLVRESNKNKLEDLINRLKIQDHVVNSFDQLENVYDQRNTVDSVGKLALEEREKTVEYLKHHINGIRRESQ